MMPEDVQMLPGALHHLMFLGAKDKTRRINFNEVDGSVTSGSFRSVSAKQLLDLEEIT
jgi:hypothetical protein